MSKNGFYTIVLIAVVIVFSIVVAVHKIGEAYHSHPELSRGDMVEVELNGAIGMIVDIRGKHIDVRFPNLNLITFDDFELTKINND